MKKSNDKILIKQILNGNISAFDKLYNKYFNKVFATTYQFICKYKVIDIKSEVTDIVQEIFIKIFDNLNKYNSKKAKLVTWINTITVNHCINWEKKKQRKLITKEFSSYDNMDLGNVSGHQSDPLENIVLKDVEQNVFNAIHKIKNDKYRLPLLLRWLLNLSNNEISEYTNRKIQTVKSDISRGKNKFIELLNKRFDSNISPNKDIILKYCDSGNIMIDETEIDDEILKLKFIDKKDIKEIAKLKQKSVKEIKSIIKQNLDRILKNRIKLGCDSGAVDITYSAMAQIPKSLVTISYPELDIEKIKAYLYPKIKSLLTRSRKF